MNTKAIREIKKNLFLTKNQQEIIAGTLLGDGHLETQDSGKTYRLKIEHCDAQKEYLKWLYQEFKSWIPSEPYTKVKKDNVYIGVRTYSHKAFQTYGRIFYHQGKKIIPKMIEKLLTPLSLAIWFMDDGSFKSVQHRTYVIHTLGYDRDELEKVQKILLKKFNLLTSLHSQKGKYWRLYIQSQSAGKFKSLIEPHILPSMKYKLGNKMPKK
jgi:recombination protein RecA